MMKSQSRSPYAWSAALAALAASSLAAGAVSAQASGQQPPAPVTVAPVTKGSVASTVTATGTVVSRNDARLAAEIAGRLDWVAEPGAQVQKGAALARVDARGLELQLRENDAQIARLAANAELLNTQLARLNALPAGIASQSQIDEAAARLSMARHELAQARATRDSTRHLIDRAVIRAPFPGHVAERIRQLGEFVAAGAEVLRLTDTANVEVVARSPVAEAGHLAVGQAVTVRAGTQQAESRIRAIVPVGDERSRMMEVRIAMPGAGWPIGSAVRVDLPAAQQSAGLLVPRDAVIVRAGGAHVYRVGKGDVAERVVVRVGNGDSKRVEITGALAAGDRVVVRGGERLRPGQAVTIAASGAPVKAATAPATPRG
jgi:RND family efflux transporter MFP subunit